MSDALGVLVLAAIVVIWIVLHVRSQPGSVATRRHARYQAKFAAAKTPVEQAQHAQAFLGEVCANLDGNPLSALAKEVFATATTHNRLTANPAVVRRTPVPAKQSGPRPAQTEGDAP